MPQDTFSAFISSLRYRREMFLPAHDDSYAQIVAGIIGFDHATQGGALAGFREWLVMNFCGLNNLAWFAIVEEVASSRGVSDPEAKAHMLFELIEAYTLDRHNNGVPSLFRKYNEWEQEQTAANDH